MKELSQVKDFYYDSIYPKLLELEGKRLVVSKKLSKLYSIAGGVLVITYLFIFYHTSLISSFIFMLFVIALLSPIYMFFYNRFTKGFDYITIFKDEILTKLIQFLDPNLAFDKNQHIPSGEYSKSHIFKQNFDRYEGNDLVSGTIDKTKISFSDIHTTYQTEAINKAKWSTIFKGVFFIADFNKEFNGNIFVLPDRLTENSNFISNFFQTYSKKHGYLAKMDNPEFEKNFVVYSDDQIEARYILTHSMMEQILKLKKQVGVEIYLSFIGEKIYIAITYNRDQFEADIFASLHDFTPIENYVQTLTLLLNIVNDLRLNDRLWSKS